MQLCLAAGVGGCIQKTHVFRPCAALRSTERHWSEALTWDQSMYLVVNDVSLALDAWCSCCGIAGAGHDVA